jgi:hypothetical protein
MTTTTAPQITLEFNYKDRDYEYSEIPRTAQLLPQIMVRPNQQVSELQFELRHLQAKKQVYSSNLVKSVGPEETTEHSPTATALRERVAIKSEGACAGEA